MDIVRIAAMGLIAAILVLVIKTQKPEIGLQISLVFGAIVLLALVTRIKSIIDLIEMYTNRIQLDGVYIKTLFKIIGIAYITEFAAESCRDAEQSAIASKIELAGKILIMVTAVPMITSVMSVITDLI